MKEQNLRDRQQPPPDNKKKPRRTLWRIAGATFAVLLLIIAGAVVGVRAWIEPIAASTPNIDDLLDARIAEPSLLYSADGTLLATYSQGRQERVALSQVSPYVLQALIATEDHRFYEHRGIDIGRTAAAILHTVNGDAQGGSTLTQQLARNMFPDEIGRARTIDRKVREMMTALKIEDVYSKQQILETYLNTVPFLYNVVGIEMAARTYYDKSAADLNVMESATLIGMLKGTSYYNPVINPGRAMKRRNVVLQQMIKHGVISDADYEAMRDQPLQVKLNLQADPIGIAPHFAAHLRKWLAEWSGKHGYNLHTDGLIVHSTIDDRLQQAATEAVARQTQVLQDIADVEWAQSSARVASHSPAAYAALRKRVEPFRHFWSERRELLEVFVRDTPEFRKAVAAGQREADVLARLKSNAAFMERVRTAKSRLEAGFVAIDPGSGEIKAWVGSRDFERDQFDHVGQAMRQPGSTFKPIVYGAALEFGLSPERAYEDGPVQIRAGDGSVWRPTDMSGWSGRMMSLREGLIHSRNGITAQVMRDIGVPNIVDFARAAGVRQSRLDPVPSLALGTSSVTLLEMVSAYTTIARVGEYRTPLMIRRITDRHGRVLAEFRPPGQRAMSEQTALELIDMLRGAVSSGTGQAIRNQFGISADVAGKTGTTQNNTDGWFILMHPGLVAGAWVGFNDSRVTMRSDYWGQGGHNAVLLVGDFFRGTLKDKLIDAKARFPMPDRTPQFVHGSDAWMEQFAVNGGPLQAGYGVITGPGGETVVTVGPDGVESIGRQAAPADIDDLGRLTITGIARGVPENWRGDTSGGSGDESHDAEPEPPGRGRVATQADVNVW
ncbi:penicillin-binding protein 1A [Noviherbaspirillum cavernae]|uniref:penicillin-binding protein 1A n=1 Tax=Noviherbaspirillum cavernae TaxID=2320862 RepID=UPI001F5BBA90|nr:transglycosylase domain-containing protein [Noviherbaspirillum cavernae]